MKRRQKRMREKLEKDKEKKEKEQNIEGTKEALDKHPSVRTHSSLPFHRTLPLSSPLLLFQTHKPPVPINILLPLLFMHMHAFCNSILIFLWWISFLQLSDLLSHDCLRSDCTNKYYHIDRIAIKYVEWRTDHWNVLSLGWKQSRDNNIHFP